MTRTEKNSVREITGLRTRFLPKSRIGQGLISIAPWLNVMLLILFFVMLDRKFVLQPGYVIALPRGPFVAGSRSDMNVIVRSVGQASAGVRKEIVYFNDQRFMVNDETQMKNFQNTLAACSLGEKAAGLVVFADARVNLETLVKIFNMAMEVGVRKVNIASRSALEPVGSEK